MLLLVFGGAESWSHGTEDHSEDKVKEVSPRHDSLVQESDFVKVEINKNYLSQVKPIFQRSCFDCHGNTTKYPWYYKIPGITQLIDSDIETAKKHLDFTQDFPFKSHDTPLNDLYAISKSIKNKTMPPLGYRLLHGDTKLTEKEVIQVQDWIQKSVEMLKLK
jgi:hypothetical protein